MAFSGEGEAVDKQRGVVCGFLEGFLQPRSSQSCWSEVTEVVEPRRDRQAVLG